MVVIWMLQIIGYLTVLTFWKHNTVKNRMFEEIAPIFSIFPFEKSDYLKFVNENDPACKAAIAEKIQTSYVPDRVLLILYFVLIGVNCYFFTLMKWNSITLPENNS